MIKYGYSSFDNIYFSFYRDRITKMLSLMHMVLASSTLERGYRGSSYQKSLCNTLGVKNVICTLIVIINLQIKLQKEIL
jgi:hypothetical protein